MDFLKDMVSYYHSFDRTAVLFSFSILKQQIDNKVELKCLTNKNKQKMSKNKTKLMGTIQGVLVIIIAAAAMWMVRNG